MTTHEVVPKFRIIETMFYSKNDCCSYAPPPSATRRATDFHRAQDQALQPQQESAGFGK